ncbi:hypothetical protein GF336_01855 [Candidatus Woesearchaeota archaeon]|nr:hypothetical protein [Candidatus Woesearchaeota archaeon]
MATPLWKALILEHRLPTKYKQTIRNIKQLPNMYKACRKANRDHQNQEQKNKPKVLLDYSLKNYGRYIFACSRVFRLAGYDVSVLLNCKLSIIHPFPKKLRCFYDLGPIDKNIFKEPVNILYKPPKSPEDYLYLTSEKNPEFLDKGWKDIIGFNFEKEKYSNPKIKKHMQAFPSKKEDSMMMNIFMYPTRYLSEGYNEIKDLRNNKRQIRAGFIGKTDASVYHKRPTKKLQSRVEIIESIKKNIKNLKIMDSEKQLEEKNRFILNNEDFRVDEKRWLQTLSKMDFFLCPSGESPLCHNLIESMAVGTIPITDHPEYYSPALEDMKNCIVFDKKNMIEKINKVLNMDQNQIEKIKKDVIDYYDSYLEPKSWVDYVFKELRL